MKITLRAAGRPDQTAEVVDDDRWVRAAIDAAWAWCNYTGAEAVTAHEANGTRIATVALTIHDDPDE